jgi:hypothetical protein
MEGMSRSRTSARSGAAQHGVRDRAVTGLLACGIAYPVTYVVANDLIAATRYPGYSRVDQVVSELSATGAPTRRFLVMMLPAFTGLTVAYGAGVWKAAGQRPALRATGLVLLASGATSIAWLPFPMSSREVIARGKATGSDTGHVVLSGLTIAEILALFGAGAGAFGTRFRNYSLTSGAVVLLSGALTSRQAAKLSTGQPTPRMGLYERISIGTWLQWMAALATILLREQRALTGKRPPMLRAADVARRDGPNVPRRTKAGARSGHEQANAGPAAYGPLNLL